MKKFMFPLLAAAVVGVGCATTDNNTTASTVAQNLTLEQALQTSADAREKVLSVKQTYDTVKTVSGATSGQNSLTDAAQNQVQKQLDTAKTQIKEEANAWKEVVK